MSSHEENQVDHDIDSRVAKLDESSYKSITSNLAEIALKCKFGDDKITIIIDMITNVDSLYSIAHQRAKKYPSDILRIGVFYLNPSLY